MNALMINAIISLLLSFGVDQNTTNNIRSLITPPQATSTPAVIIPVTVTPVIENQPIYFGSTQPTPLPVNNPPQVIQPVIQLPPMDTTPPIFNQFTMEGAPGNILRIEANEKLDFAKTTFSGNQEMKITVDGRDDGLQPFGPPENQKHLQAYYYEAEVSGDSGSFTVTVQDLAGNLVTREAVKRIY